MDIPHRRQRNSIQNKPTVHQQVSENPATLHNPNRQSTPLKLSSQLPQAQESDPSNLSQKSLNTHASNLDIH